MPDLTDMVQDRVARDCAAAVAARIAARAPASRLCVCGCGEPVEPARYAAGCCRTLECQRAYEARERAFGRRP